MSAEWYRTSFWETRMLFCWRGRIIFRRKRDLETSLVHVPAFRAPEYNLD